MLVLASIAVLVIYVQHIGQALRVSALIELVGKDTRKLVDRVYPDTGPSLDRDPDAPRVVRARESGVVTMIGTKQLVAEARTGRLRARARPGARRVRPRRRAAVHRPRRRPATSTRTGSSRR